jgi:hypothetical protein
LLRSVNIANAILIPELCRKLPFAQDLAVLLTREK